MKNIHILSTDKPSRLIYNDANQLCYHSNKSYKNDRKWMHRKKFNIYITNNEVIKKGDWIFDAKFNLVELAKYGHEDLKRDWLKIILTTDQSLIADGVQAIDDEFLKWWIKNPSCDRIDFVLINDIEPWYKIRFPKEETKQETLEEAANHYAEGFEYKQPSEHGLFVNSFQGFISGAKWQQEQDKNKYSEEEVLDITKQAYSMGRSNYTIKAFNEWFEQFKKK